MFIISYSWKFQICSCCPSQSFLKVNSYRGTCSAALTEELENQEAGGQAGELLKALMREARKEDPQYRCHSLVALGEVLLALKLDKFEEVYALVTPILRKVSIVIL
jgi:hypothetical protein